MKLNKLFLAIATVIILGFAANYVFKHIGSFKHITDINVMQVFTFFSLQLVTHSINTFILLILLHAFGVRLSFHEGFALSCTKSFFNYIFLKGGVFAKGYFLKRIYDFSYTGFLVFLTSLILIYLMVAGFLGVLLMLVVYLADKNFNIFLFLCFSGMAVSFIVFVKLSDFRNIIKEKDNLFFQRLYKLLDSWHIINQSRKNVLMLSTLVVLNYISYACRLKYGFHILYEDVSFIKCLVLSILGEFSAVISITPAALGIKEFFVGACYSLMKGDMLQAIVVTTADRAISIILVFFLGLLSCFYLTFKKTGKLFAH